MKSPIPLLPGERILFSSARGGDAGHSGWWWLLAIFGGMQVCNGLTFTLFFFNSDPAKGRSFPVLALATLLVSAVVFARWLQLRLQPTYFVTNQRLVARRFFLAPLTIAPSDVGAAARFLIKHTRYGRVMRKQLTHSIVIALRSGGTHRFGPVKDAEAMLVFLEGLAQGVIDVRALPGENGELSAAETRRDLYFARTTKAAGAERGPIFVGPTTVIGYAGELLSSYMLQLYTIVGAERSAEDIEQSMISLAANTVFGRAVVMQREGKTLKLDGLRLVLADETSHVAFELQPADAARAAAQLPKDEPHPYR